MSTTVAGVKLMAIAYAWSAKGTSFFITTIGSTEVADEMYTTSFEDDYGVVGTVDIPRPSICSFLYKMLPTIDEHNAKVNISSTLQRAGRQRIVLCALSGKCWGSVSLTASA
jgi:hypothetical protein